MCFVSDYHLCNASVCQDVACMDEAVKHLSCLLDKITLVGIVLQFLICTQTPLIQWSSTET